MTEPEAPVSTKVSGERVHPASPLVHAWVGVLAVAWFFLQSFINDDGILEAIDEIRKGTWDLPLGLILIGVGAVLALAFAYWHWWTTKFVIDDREFRLENTGAFRESKRIAFSRIQSVDVEQPLAARVLGLAQVRIDVGGEGGATLAFLPRARATQIRDYLMTRAHGRRVATTETARSASAWDDSAAGDNVLIRLSAGDILLSAFLSLDIYLMVLTMLAPGAVALWFDEPGTAVIATGGTAVPILLAIAGMLSKRLFGQFNYTLARTPAGLRITRGLFTLRSQTIPVHRVQSLTISQPVLWRFLNRAKLQITVMSSDADADEGEIDSQTIYLPIGTPQQVQLAIAELWPGLHLEDLEFRRPPERAKWLDPLQYSWMGYALDEQVVVSRRGWLHRQQSITPHARVQSVQIQQGPLERRLRLANVAFHTVQMLAAPVAHLDEAQARQLALTQMSRARASRMSELTNPPGLRYGTAPLPTPADGDLWLPVTAPQPAPTMVPAQPVLGGPVQPPPPVGF